MVPEKSSLFHRFMDIISYLLLLQYQNRRGAFAIALHFALLVALRRTFALRRAVKHVTGNGIVDVRALVLTDGSEAVAVEVGVSHTQVTIRMQCLVF